MGFIVVVKEKTTYVSTVETDHATKATNQSIYIQRNVSKIVGSVKSVISRSFDSSAPYSAIRN